MNKARILVAPLNWGLGHASRCIPVIQHILSLGFDVILGGDGIALALLKKEFPFLECISIPDYKIRYSKSSHMSFHFLKQMPSFFNHYREEHRLINKIIEENHIDAIISDNRYGLYSKSIPCVIITHQVNPPFKYFSGFLQKKIQNLLNRFDQCWIIDYSGKKSISGKISSPGSLRKYQHIGPISRFKVNTDIKKFEILVILSGPEPQRSIFEKEVIDQLKEIEGEHLVIRGTENELTKPVGIKNITFQNLTLGTEISALIDQSNYLVSRSGYSSIMDYLFKARCAILVPTPGQYEQESLSKSVSKDQFVIQSQGNIDLVNGIKKLKDLPAPNVVEMDKSFKTILEDFCSSIY